MILGPEIRKRKFCPHFPSSFLSFRSAPSTSSHFNNPHDRFYFFHCLALMFIYMDVFVGLINVRVSTSLSVTFVTSLFLLVMYCW